MFASMDDTKQLAANASAGLASVVQLKAARNHKVTLAQLMLNTSNRMLLDVAREDDAAISRAEQHASEQLKAYQTRR